MARGRFWTETVNAGLGSGLAMIRFTAQFAPLFCRAGF